MFNQILGARQSSFQAFKSVSCDIKENWLDLVGLFNASPKANYLKLQTFLEDDSNKLAIKEQISCLDSDSLDAAWDGSLAVLHTFVEDESSRISSCDLNLLEKDLSIITNFLLTASLN